MTDQREPDLNNVDSPPRQSLEYEKFDCKEDIIGSGGQGIISRVTLEEEAPPEYIAIKQPIADNRTIKLEEIQSVLEEASIWEKVDRIERSKQRWEGYNHIVGIVDTGETLPWIAMEYMDGGSLDHRLEDNPEGLPLDEALWIAECVCRGIKIAHNHGITHLDIKPANILFRETSDDKWNVPKISDWGLARLSADRDTTMEELSVLYAAPEQFDRDEFGDVDSLTDIYQVGALLYAMLTGEPPYTGGQFSVVQNIVSEKNPVAPRSGHGSLSKKINETVLLALETRKDKRYQNIHTFEQALNSIRTNSRPPGKVVDRIDSTREIEPPDNDSHLIGSELRKNSIVDKSIVTTPQSSLPSTSSTENWPMFQAGPALTGNSLATGPQETVTAQWTSRTDGLVTSSPAVVDNAIYVGCHEGKVYKINAKNGVKNWNFQTEDQVISSPAVVNNTVYVGSNDGGVYALDAETGTESWCFQTDKQVWSSPAVVDNTVYIGSNDGGVYALDARTGAERWCFQTKDKVRSSPAVADRTVYIGSFDNNIYALDAKNGDKRWCFQTGGRVLSSPAVTASMVYVGSNDGSVYALNPETGIQRWHFKTGKKVISSPAVVDDHIFIGNNDGCVYSLEANTGNERWCFRTGDSSLIGEPEVRSSPGVVDGTVYFGCNDSKIYALDAETGTESWHYQTDKPVWSSPAISNNTVYVGGGSFDRNVYALTEA